MAEAKVTIGAVAQRTGLSVHAIRLYERDGLFAGDVQRDSAGRRVYSDWDVDWLVNCTKFRSSGMSLTTISRLAALVRAGSGNEAERLELLREHRGHIAQQLGLLHATVELIDNKVAGYEAHLAAGASGDPW